MEQGNSLCLSHQGGLSRPAKTTLHCGSDPAMSPEQFLAEALTPSGRQGSIDLTWILASPLAMVINPRNSATSTPPRLLVS